MDPPIQTLLLDLSKTEKRVRFLAPCGSRIVKFLTHDWFVRWTTNTEGKECSSILSSRLWGEALRDCTKDGCVKDKPTTSLLLISVFMMLKKKKKRQINYLKLAQNASQRSILVGRL